MRFLGRGSEWWELRADGPPGADASRDSGRVPLSSQKNAKGGGPRTQLATFVAQTSVLGPPTYFPASQEETSSLHPGSSVPGCPSALCIGGMREGKEGCGGRDGIGGSQTIRGALWAPRHREIVDVKLKKGLGLST